MSKYFKSLKTGKVAELVADSEQKVVLLFENGEERELAHSTFKRWWKVTDEEAHIEHHEETQSNEDTASDASISNLDVPEGETIQDKILVAAMKLAEASSSELFVREGTKNYNFRKNGVIYFWFTLTKSGVTLRAKSKATKNLKLSIEPKHMNHNYDLRFDITEWSTTAYELVRQLHDASLVYQMAAKKK